MDLGVDVVCVNERDEVGSVQRKGWDAWIQTFADIFSDREIADMGDISYLDAQPTSGSGAANAQDFAPRESIMARLRNFYAHWCLKEAYLKMTGEALLF